MKTTTAIIIIILFAIIGYGVYSTRTTTTADLRDTDIATTTMDADTTTNAAQEWNINAAGLGIRITKNGNGPAAQNGDIVAVHYTGTLENGTVFDSSRTQGTPIEFALGAGQVIAGWEQGILGMQVGERRTLNIPPELGYGAAGAGGVIPPNATLLFDVELVGIR